MRIAIIDYGSGNTQSVKYALKRLGCESVLTSDKEIISSSDKVIFPGVGQVDNQIQQEDSLKIIKIESFLERIFIRWMNITYIFKFLRLMMSTLNIIEKDMVYGGYMELIFQMKF